MGERHRQTERDREWGGREVSMSVHTHTMSQYVSNVYTSVRSESVCVYVSSECGGKLSGLCDRWRTDGETVHGRMPASEGT